MNDPSLISLLFVLVAVVASVSGESTSEAAIYEQNSPPVVGKAYVDTTTPLQQDNYSFNSYYNYNVYDRNYENQNRTSDDGGSSSRIMKILPLSSTVKPKIESAETAKQQDVKNSHSEIGWISKPLREGLSNFKVRPANNPKCESQSNLYEMHQKNLTLWAVRMAESSQMEPVGIIGGTTYQMGNFEECIKTDGYGVKGKYCLANFHYLPISNIWQMYQKSVAANDFRDMNHEASVWEAMVRLKRDPVRIDRQTLYWGFCIPSSCSAQDLEYTLNQSLIESFRKYSLELNITVDPIYCHTKEKTPFTKGFYITITFMAILLLINVLSTIFDFYEYLTGKYSYDVDGWRELVGVFSMWRNIYSLGVYNKDSQVKIANGAKVIMMILIIYGHSLLYILGYPQFNPASLEEVYRRGADIALVNTNIVDVFFAISGFLTFYYGYHPMKIGGMVYLVLSVIFRYLRLMPVFAIIIAYMTFVLPYTSDGPIWNARIQIEVENCYKNWWLDILLLNNFFNVDEQCVLISWYITTDMLLCIIASVLLYLIIKKPKLGLFLSVFILMGSIFVTFMVTYANKHNGLMKLYMTLLENHRKSIEFKELYAALYSRAGPYLVGFLAAYLTILLQRIKYQISNKWLLIGCVISIAIGEGSQYYGIVFYQFGRPFNLLENALYSCLHRVLFAGLISWFLLAYLTSGFGILDSFINFRMFTVLGRITYSVFLMNTLSLITLTASMRVPVFYSYKMIMFLVFGDVLTTYILGFLFYIYAEGPICGISKLLQKKLAQLFASQIEKAKQRVENVKTGISGIKKNSIDC